MKFVFFGYDFSIEVAKRLIRDGHEMIGVFTFPCDNIFNFNRDLIALAQKKNIPVTDKKPTPNDIESFLNQGCDVFLSCGYSYKIPSVGKAYGINTHPSYLPAGRGLMPTPQIMMHAPEAAGFTVHKITDEFDAGDILYQEKITLTERDTVDTYSAQIAKRSPDAIAKIFAALPEYWKNAKPQDQSKASYFKSPTKAMRTINWKDDVKDIDRMLRAFGSFGGLAMLNGKTYGVFAHEWENTSHDFAPGTIVDAGTKGIKIAAKGGYVTFTKFVIL